MVKRGSFNGGSTVFKEGSNWFGFDQEHPLSPQEQADISFANLLKEAEKQPPIRSPIDSHSKMKAKRKAAQRALEIGSDRAGSFTVEVRQKRKTLNKPTGNEKGSL